MDTKTNFSGGYRRKKAFQKRFRPKRSKFSTRKLKRLGLIYCGMSKKNKKLVKAAYFRKKIDEKNEFRNRWSNVPWNISPDGTPITNEANKRSLTYGQIDAFNAALESVVAKLDTGQAFFRDIPPKPFGVSLLDYQQMLKPFGLRFANGSVRFFSKLKNKKVTLFAKARNEMLVASGNKNPKRVKKKKVCIDSDPLLYVIFAHASYPDVQLTTEQIINLENDLYSICTEESILIKSGLKMTRIGAGTLLVVCENEDNLENVKSKLNLLSETSNTPLKMIDQIDLNNSVIMIASFYGPSVPSNIIAKLLASQNYALDTRNWIFNFIEKDYFGDLYEISMDSVSSLIIFQRSNTLFYGLGKVTLKFISEEPFKPGMMAVKQEENDELQESDEDKKFSQWSDCFWDDVKEDTDSDDESDEDEPPSSPEYFEIFNI